MKYTVFIGDRLFSSWSLRGWLSCAAFDLPYSVAFADLYGGKLQKDLRLVPPARTVPAMLTPDAVVLWDSLAIGEELATRHPEAGLWPSDTKARATARSLAAEIHSGFGALRSECPMNLLSAFKDTFPSEAVLADLRRIETLWSFAFSQHDGEWLCGDYSLADVFFAPVAARIAGYDLPVSAAASDYVAQHLSHEKFRQWRAMALAEDSGARPYPNDFLTAGWPGPSPRAATASNGPSINATCPYSGEPVTDFLLLDSVEYGFCNPFCRDKTLSDPDAWLAFVDLRRKSAR